MLEAQAALRHGQWLPWLDSLGVPARTAQAYRQLARLDPANAQRVAHLGLRQALKAISVAGPEKPAPARRTVVDPLVEMTRLFTALTPEDRLGVLRRLRDGDGSEDDRRWLQGRTDDDLRRMVMNTVHKGLVDPGWFVRGAVERVAAKVRP